MYASSDTSWAMIKKRNANYFNRNFMQGTPQSVSDADTVRERGPTPEIGPESFDYNQRSVRARGLTPEMGPNFLNPQRPVRTPALVGPSPRSPDQCRRSVRARGSTPEIVSPQSPDQRRRSVRARGSIPELVSPQSPDQCRRSVRARGSTPELVRPRSPNQCQRSVRLRGPTPVLLGPRSPDRSRRSTRARGLTPELVGPRSPDHRRRQVRARAPSPEVVCLDSPVRHPRHVRSRGPTPERVAHRSPYLRRSCSEQRMYIAQKKADSRTVLVYNLPDDVDRKDLTNLFKDYGKIRSLTVPLDSNYDFMGFAYVQFKHRWSSYYAIMEKNYRLYRSCVLRVESEKSYLNKIARRRAQGRPYHDVTAGGRRYDHQN